MVDFVDEVLTAEQKQKKKLWDYDFQAVNGTDYELTIIIYTLNRIMKLVFNKAVKSKVLKQKPGAKVQQIDNKVIDEVNEIIVAPHYYNLVNTASRKTLGVVQDIVLRDGVHILNSKIVVIKFKRNKEYRHIWECHILYEGQYKG